MNVDPANGPVNSQMNAAIVDLANAIDQHALALSRVNTARRDETAALNHVNEAQKRVDALVAELKKQSPRESDWRRPPGVATA